MESYDISIVIPTWNRSELLCVLMESLYKARQNYRYGKSEVVIVDSSKDEEKQRIVEGCGRFDCRYLEGPDSVRKKRNMGIVAAEYPFILFIDSDVTVDADIMNHHMETYRNAKGERLGGTFGVTEFVGKDTFFWKVVKYTTYVDSFSFAKKFPYQSWTIGNNVMFKKSVLEEINMFEEAFPFKLGGDDLDMSYRVTKAGYAIKSVPEAVTWHSNETWNHIKSINDRAKRWGSMEYYLQQRHPEIFITGGIKAELFMAIVLIFSLLSALAAGSWFFLAGGAGSVLFAYLSIFMMDAKERRQPNLLYYSIAKIFESRYYIFHILEGLKHKSLCGFYKTMSFSYYQTRAMMNRESSKLWRLFLSLLVYAVIVLVLKKWC